MRILFLNPNTSPHITELLVRAAQANAGEGTEIIGATARFGARYIGSRAAAAVAAHAALDAFADEAALRMPDAVVLACFGDPGLAALREIAECPVVGLAEASILAATEMGERFAIVTGGSRWKPMLEELVASMQLTPRLAAVEALPLTGAAMAAEPEQALDLISAGVRRVAERGAEVVILGGAGMAGLASRLPGRVAVPLIDCVDAAVRAAEAAAAAPHPDGKGGRGATTESTGLSPGLAALLP
jgi:allantoin racemase